MQGCTYVNTWVVFKFIFERANTIQRWDVAEYI